jgi:hypothetical protein
MTLSVDLARIASAASAHAAPEEEVAAIVVTEDGARERTYVVAFVGGPNRTWLALDGEGEPVVSRERVRQAVSIGALCEIADEAAGSSGDGDLRVATPGYLDEIGTRAPPELNVPAAIRGATTAVDELTREVEAGYKLPLR